MTRSFIGSFLIESLTWNMIKLAVSKIWVSYFFLYSRILLLLTFQILFKHFQRFLDFGAIGGRKKPRELMVVYARALQNMSQSKIVDELKRKNGKNKPGSNCGIPNEYG
jgi:hypothetical protein